ncbi:MAG: diguanylate cyclase [Gammaproteobacteria bacterium]|nr:diguanylate cyclase [Gammaproteobacteria bacterium]
MNNSSVPRKMAEVWPTLIDAERLRTRVAEAVIVMSDRSTLPSVTVSLGAVQMTPHQSGEKLVAEADAALAGAKAHGRNCVAE